MKCLTCHGLITNGNCGCSTGTHRTASVNIGVMLRDRDAKIARLKAEVERHLRCTSSYPEKQAACARKDDEIARLKVQIETLQVEHVDLYRAEARLRAALAAGPAALRRRGPDSRILAAADTVEAAQERALKGGG